MPATQKPIGTSLGPGQYSPKANRFKDVIKQKEEDRKKDLMFGREDRFGSPSKNKSPGPGSYAEATTAQW